MARPAAPDGRLARLEIMCPSDRKTAPSRMLVQISRIKAGSPASASVPLLATAATAATP